VYSLIHFLIQFSICDNEINLHSINLDLRPYIAFESSDRLFAGLLREAFAVCRTVKASNLVASSGEITNSIRIRVHLF
jgi:hypothetical protein